MFDPTLPAPQSPMVSAEMRNQFNGLKDLIDAIPPAPPEVDPVFTASEAVRFAPGDKAKLDALAAVVRPKVFRARMTQDDDANPTLQVIANELGVSPTATRDGTGTYYIQLPGAFAGMSYGNVVARPVAYMNTMAHEPRYLFVAADSDDALLVIQYKADGTTVDGMSSNGMGILIEALVYGG